MMDFSEIFNNVVDSPSSDKKLGDPSPDISKYNVDHFIKEISNHKDKRLLAIKEMKILDSNLDSTELGETYSYIFYKNCWEFISLIDISNKEHLKVLREVHKSPLEWSLGILLFYFQDIEDYLKCLFLQKIIEVL